uniref:Putative secreted protein n=1 Tax=Anopheles darlingi TaxID=43151 RepID=A0A2M4D972_ANODA
MILAPMMLWLSVTHRWTAPIVLLAVSLTATIGHDLAVLLPIGQILSVRVRTLTLILVLEVPSTTGGWWCRFFNSILRWIATSTTSTTSNGGLLVDHPLVVILFALLTVPSSQHLLAATLLHYVRLFGRFEWVPEAWRVVGDDRFYLFLVRVDRPLQAPVLLAARRTLMVVTVTGRLDRCLVAHIRIEVGRRWTWIAVLAHACYWSRYLIPVATTAVPGSRPTSDQIV